MKNEGWPLPNISLLLALMLDSDSNTIFENLFFNIPPNYSRVVWKFHRSLLFNTT